MSLNSICSVRFRRISMPCILLEGSQTEAKEDILVHLVSTRGILKSEESKKISNRFPEILPSYYNLCKNHSSDYLLGVCQFSEVSKGKHIASIFAQMPSMFGREKIHLGALRIALITLKNFATQNELTVSIPYKFGIIKSNEWQTASMILDQVFYDYAIAMYEESLQDLRIAE
jgi:hypothetical protein